MRICLDTSAFAGFLRGHVDCVDLVRRAEFVGLPTVVLAEVRLGFRVTGHRKRNEALLSRFASRSVVEILDIDQLAARHYEDIVLSLRERHLTVPTNDVWIASVAAREGATLLTYQRNFTLIERIASEILSLPGSPCHHSTESRHS